MHLSFDLKILPLGILLKKSKNYMSTKYLYKKLHSSLIHNSKILGKVQVSINNRMDKQTVVHLCNEILLNYKKKKTINTNT